MNTEDKDDAGAGKEDFFFGAKITRDFFVKTQKYTYEFSHLTIFL